MQFVPLSIHLNDLLQKNNTFWFYFSSIGNQSNHFIIIPNLPKFFFVFIPISIKATPDSIAAFATAGATILINLGSNGLE
jgi:hypothetical protein